MLRDKDSALARVLYPRCHGEEGISGDGRLGSPFTSSIHHRTGNAFLFCAGGGEGEPITHSFINTVLFNCFQISFFFFRWKFFFQFNRFSLREPAGVMTTNSGVAFDGIFENPIEMGGFRGVCNGISA